MPASKRPALGKRLLRKMILEHHGNTAIMARELGVSPYMVTSRINRDDELKRIRQQARRALVDKAASTLIEAAENGNLQAAERILHFYGRHDGVMPANVQKVELSEEEQERIIGAVRRTFQKWIPADSIAEAQADFVKFLSESGESASA